MKAMVYHGPGDARWEDVPECTDVKVGDRVIVSCVTKCMDCDYCRRGLTSHCQTVGGIGWISDILPTGYEIGVRDGGVQEGNTVVVVGAGPVGLAAIMTARSTGAERVIAVDTNEYRLERARDFGATDVVTGGTVANVGVHGKAFEFPIHEKWIENLRFTTGPVNATTAPDLLRDIEAGTVKPEEFVTHRFTFDEWEQAYDTFGRAAEEKALTVIVSAS